MMNNILLLIFLVYTHLSIASITCDSIVECSDTVVFTNKFSFQTKMKRLNNNSHVNTLKQKDATEQKEALYLLFFILLTISLFIIYKIYNVNIKNIEKEHRSPHYHKENNSINILCRDLESSSKRHRLFAMILTCILIILITFIIFIINYDFIPSQANTLNTADEKKTPYLLIYYLTRAFFFASMFTAAFYYLYQLTKSSFDQSVRYRKRLNSLLFLNYIFDKKLKINNETTLTELMSAYEKWTSNIDSAFSNEDKKKRTNEFNINKDNVSAKIIDE